MNVNGIEVDAGEVIAGVIQAAGEAVDYEIEQACEGLFDDDDEQEAA